jgi:hypothetical protein
MGIAVSLAALARRVLSDGSLPASAVAGALPAGAVQQFIQTSAPAGWVIMNGGSIGNAASNATTRANADTAALFAVIWDGVAQADATVQDSAGSTVARGANAAADFAANRRIILPDMRGEFSRGLDAGRGVDASRANGSAQGHALQSHSHTVDSYVSGATGTDGRPQEGTSGSSDSFQTLTSGTTGTFATETRPRNRAWTWYAKL